MPGKFHCLVADTTAFINNVSLQDRADYIISVPEVIKEIKNKRQLKRLCVLPYDLTVDEPSPESVQHVIEFSKRTGDYRSLSSADIKVIALTYQLEKELVGTEHLRTEPIVTRVISSKTKPEEFIDRRPLAGFYMPPNAEQLEKKTLLNAELEELKEKDTESVEKVELDESESENDDQKDEIAEEKVEIENTKLETEINKKLENLNLKNLEDVLVSVKSEENEESSDSSNADSEDEDDDDGWITPANLAEVKSTFGKDVAEEMQVRVACMSTDYSVQNVLKQMNCNIAALDGKIIKHLRTYILRCYGCFKTTTIMTKMFCPNCGHKTLKKVAVSLDENGQQVIHINTRRQITAKGKNTSIPRPRGGKHSTNPILCEDQPIPKQMPSRVARTKTNALEEDYIAGYSPFVARDVDSKSALLRAKAGGHNIKQWAKNHAYRNMLRSQKKF